MPKTLLLDTNVIIWMQALSDRLGSTARGLLEDSTQPLVVSYFSFQEMVMKTASGKMTYDDRLYDELRIKGVIVTPPSRQALQNYKIFNPDNRDPFDNILLAVAMSEGYDFMTSDQKILDTVLPGVRMIDSRR